MKNRPGRWTSILLVYLLLAYLLTGVHRYSAETYRPPGAGPDIQAQINWLGATLRRNGGETTQAWYPEGYFFVHALYGLALVNQTLLNPDDAALRDRNIREIEWVIDRLDSPAGYAPFPRGQAVEYGVFYQGWRNRLLGGLLLITPESDRGFLAEEQFHFQTEALAGAYLASPAYHLEAYPGQSWPVDNVVALTSLRLHDHLYGTGYGEVVDGWLAYTRSHLDPATGLIPHSVDPRTGEILQGSRGSSLVLLLSFLPELDDEFSRAQYSRYRKLYSQAVLDFVLAREYPRGTFGFGDVDSGPLVAGLSPVATGVSFAAARANGDEEVFERTIQLAETLGMPVAFRDQKRYGLGWLPAGDAFLVWGKTLVRWPSQSILAADYPRLTSDRYPWTNAIALLLAAGAWIPFLREKIRKRPA